MRKLYLILHWISKINTYLGILFLLVVFQKITLGIVIRNVFHIYSNLIYIIYFIIGSLIIARYINIESPYKKYL